MSLLSPSLAYLGNFLALNDSNIMRYLFLFFMVATALPALADDRARLSYDGTAGIVDGDSLFIGNTEMRFLCMDAVELHQSCAGADGEEYPCGELAKDALRDLIGALRVHCHGHIHDKYNRPLVQCYAGHVNLNRAMVEQGWAISMCKKFKPLEAQAKEAKRGVWQGAFDLPWNWRKAHPWHP